MCSTRNAVRYRRIARIPTVSGARTSLFVPEMDRLTAGGAGGVREASGHLDVPASPLNCRERMTNVILGNRSIGAERIPSHVPALSVLCLMIGLTTCLAYRPFDGTDAAVAEKDKIEIEMQPAGAVQGRIRNDA